MSGHSKKILFWIITLLIPVFLLALIEIGFRISSYNSEGRELFVEYAVNDDYLIVNPNYVTRYFPSFVPQIAPNPFRKEKSDSTFRVFVFGGSSAQGFPYNFYYSFANQLEQKLLLNTKSLNVEVINLGMTAVNSYVIHDLAKSVKDYEADAIIIYAGHNEYYGSFGVGSTQFNIGNSVWMKRLILWFKNFLLYQFMEDLLAPSELNTGVQRTLMARVVSESNIRKESQVYEAGIEQFETNIEDVLSIFKRKDVPVFIGTVASNLKDQPPLGSFWDAINAYDLGNQFLAIQDTIRAKNQFENAKEFDTIRFRAPNAINQKIREFATQEDVYLVDVETVLNELSISGIADNSMFIDHLHPNEIGHNIMADLFFNELLEIGLLSESYAESRFDTPLTISDFENSFSSAAIARLLNGYPFVKGLTPEEELAAFELAFQQLQSISYADSIGANTWRFDELVAVSLREVVKFTESNNDSISYAQHYYELVHWLPFNSELLREGIEYASNNRALDIYTVNMIHKAINNNLEGSYLSTVLEEIYKEGVENSTVEN